MSRQHATPLIVPAIGVAVPLAALGPEAHGWSEAKVQALIQAHPACLPIREIDPLFADPVPLCTEMSTGAGPIDNVMITASGLPVLVECKLWRNPQARREVIGQILDYAKELSRWTASDLQREVSRRTGRTGNAVVDLVREAGHQVDEIGFTDAVTLNLRRGRFLLLIVGDGIREGVEAITEYVQGQAGLHFTLGLVEMPIFTMPDGARLVAPRVVARTVNVTRTVIAVPDGNLVVDDIATGGESSTDLSLDTETVAFSAERQAFWTDFLSGLRLSDPAQPIPAPYKLGYIAFTLPAPGGSAWLTVYRDLRGNEMGISLSSNRNSVGETAMLAIAADWENVRLELGGEVTLTERQGRPWVNEARRFGPLVDPRNREQAFAWLRPRVDDFVNVLRPRVASIVQDLTRS
ncbi:MAG TPA: hypothetical protein VF592_06995 [Sphingomonas sp.]|jgi:hypothetical protein|uniref:hypothetical protein n=1 Tax=Sphingomonas sp. TaxID=28214 RepID=UPI002ED93C30